MKRRTSRRELDRAKGEGRRAKGEVGGALWIGLFAAGPVLAATNPASPDAKPVLLPPHAELPPTFWEQYGLWVALAVLLLLVLAALAAWRGWRPKPTAPIPIAVQARRELERLRGQPEDGRTLSGVSRSLRRYLTLAFELPPEELTTSEFCQAAGASGKVGPDLAAQAAEFLRRCDEQKFAPSGPPRSLDAAARALELVERGEARRAQLREAMATAPPVLPSAASTA